MNCLSCSTKESLHSCTSTSFRILGIRLSSSARRSRTHYQILGVPSTASAKEIKSAYIELCKKHHPDANQNDPEAQKKFVELQEAYNALSSPVDRARYDVKTNKAYYNTRSAGSSSEDFVRNYYRAQAKEQQRRRHMDDWMNQFETYNDPADEFMRKEREQQREILKKFYRNGRDIGYGPRWARDYHYYYNDYNQSGGRILRFAIVFIIWSTVLSFIGSSFR